MVEITLIQLRHSRYRPYTAGHGMPTDAFTQIMDRQEILGNTMHVTKANVV